MTGGCPDSGDDNRPTSSRGDHRRVKDRSGRGPLRGSAAAYHSDGEVHLTGPAPDPHKTSLDLENVTRAHRREELDVGVGGEQPLVAVGLVESRNAARRAIADGGASVNGTKVSDAESVLTEEDFLHGEVAILRRGRKAMAAGRPESQWAQLAPHPRAPYLRIISALSLIHI